MFNLDFWACLCLLNRGQPNDISLFKVYKKDPRATFSDPVFPQTGLSLMLAVKKKIFEYVLYAECSIFFSS